MSQPPPILDNAQVLWWVWSGEIPFGELPGEVGDDRMIHGFAVCRYENGKIYRFSCDKNWQVRQDVDCASEEEAKGSIPISQYEVSRIIWQPWAAPIVWYEFNRRKLKSPIILAVLMLVLVVLTKQWIGLIGLPLIYLGWVFCAPNLNLIDGWIPLLSAGMCGILSAVFFVPGLAMAAIFGGLSWLAASYESVRHCKPKTIALTEANMEDKTAPAKK